jgi:hypothetical protein
MFLEKFIIEAQHPHVFALRATRTTNAGHANNLISDFRFICIFVLLKCGFAYQLLVF